ncbi:hypothetical protein E3N88_28882 [Mikania micrantha]|uniref:Uncharacterized protein n=1 Tax=Mikania micrantha TaxID=192012 RepID=A0A5N6N1A3_9ASTR|nr:hypothetical protein E3N88_28882 [Mikania micrantha]
MERNHEQDQAISQLTHRVNEQNALLLQAADQRADFRARNADPEDRFLKSVDEHNQLALTTYAYNERILALEADNLRLTKQVESLKDSTPRIEAPESYYQVLYMVVYD